MILNALIKQLNQHFQHEKRAQVCLWFDEKQESDRLLSALGEHLASMKQPPFELLRYDAKQCHGQIWFKHQVNSQLKRLPPAERSLRRFVFYLPLSEDRLDTPDEQGRHHLELLEEYRVAGIIWRINGKRPTLFGFLRQIQIPLPDSPSDQRKLYDGGRDSLLAKYVAKFLGRPPIFWETAITPALAQSRLVGDVEQYILDLAVSPETNWQSLSNDGLTDEFLQSVRERYGFEAATIDPAAWVAQLVETLALTETFLGYSEPPDFPFADRLPPLALREHHVQLLNRWLRDAESRPAWDRWIADVEPNLDLSSWAADKPGLSFGLPHLVAQRWQRTLSAFEDASAKTSTIDAFFEEHRTVIQRETEFAKASHNPVGAWALLASLDQHLIACRSAIAKTEQAVSAADLANLYVQLAPVVDRQHLRLRSQAMEHNLPTVGKVADRSYAAYTNQLNERFFTRYTQQDSPDIVGIPNVTSHVEHGIWHGNSRRAVIIVDALRYDCAHEIKDRLAGQDVDVSALRATLPTVTPIGMTSLLPLASTTVTLETKSNQLHPKVNGKDMAARGNRLDYLREFGADCREIEDVENASSRPDKLGDLLVVFGHDDVDHIGHGSAESLIRHIDHEVARLASLVRKLHQWDYPEIHIVTDHGFTLLNEEKLPDEVKCEKDWCVVLKERFALVPATADVPLASLPSPWTDALRVALPPGLAFFKAEKAFSHGGAALQELIIPHLVSRVRIQEKRIGVEVVLPTYNLMRTAVKVVLRPKSETTTGQKLLFAELGRTLQVDVCRTETSGESKSVLAAAAKEVRLEANQPESNVTLFFHTALTFKTDEILDLRICDVETSEQFPPRGIKLTVGRDM